MSGKIQPLCGERCHRGGTGWHQTFYSMGFELIDPDVGTLHGDRILSSGRVEFANMQYLEQSG